MISNTLWLRKHAQNFLSPNTYPHPRQQSPPLHVNSHYHHLARQWTTTHWPHASSKFSFSFLLLNAIITSTSIRVHPRPSPAPIRAHPRPSPSAFITYPHPCPSASVITCVHYQSHPPPLHSPALKVSPTTVHPCRGQHQVCLILFYSLHC